MLRKHAREHGRHLQLLCQFIIIKCANLDTRKNMITFFPDTTLHRDRVRSLRIIPCRHNDTRPRTLRNSDGLRNILTERIMKHNETHKDHILCEFHSFYSVFPWESVEHHVLIPHRDETHTLARVMLEFVLKLCEYLLFLCMFFSFEIDRMCVLKNILRRTSNICTTML